jgi:predicted nucleic acid-binding Zn ribbon protein
MADRIDEAGEREREARDQAMARVRRQVGWPKTWHTHCGWCGDATENGDRYCSYGLDSCASDAMRQPRIRARQGRVE